MKARWVWCAAVHGSAELNTTEWLNNSNSNRIFKVNPCHFLKYLSLLLFQDLSFIPKIWSHFFFVLSIIIRYFSYPRKNKLTSLCHIIMRILHRIPKCSSFETHNKLMASCWVILAPHSCPEQPPFSGYLWDSKAEFFFPSSVIPPKTSDLLLIGYRTQK